MGKISAAKEGRLCPLLPSGGCGVIPYSICGPPSCACPEPPRCCGAQDSRDHVPQQVAGLRLGRPSCSALGTKQVPSPPWFSESLAFVQLSPTGLCHRNDRDCLTIA